MATVSSTDGSPTKTCWKRRSSAGSFSIRSRYSSSVVAPTSRSSPRASIGLSMLPASMAESPLAPAPTTVCSSSMKVTTSPSLLRMSSSTALSRSSNSPRYFAPATIAARSRDTNRLSRNDSGTSPATIRWARPSTTAVLPTPGSPISTGLFLVRRESTCTTRRISLSRPITGSSLPSRAAAVRSTLYLSSASYDASGLGEVTFRPPRRPGMAASIAAVSRPKSAATASSRWSVETNVSPMAVIAFWAASSTASAERDSCGGETEAPLTAGSARSADSAAWVAAAGDEPAAPSSAAVVVSLWRASAASR